MIKIGFIHFDDLYLIHHFIGSAVELFNVPECDVDILTPETNQEYLYSLLDLYKIPRTIVKQLPTFTYKKIAYKFQKRPKPSNQYIFKKNRKQLLKYDVLVFTVMNHMRLGRKGRNPKFVLLMHGAGDADYPFIDIYKERVSNFDLITTAGQKINDLFKNLGELPNTEIKICGYQKLDAVKIENKTTHFFKNDKPVVLYNPHYRKHITSFNKYGHDILEYFFNNQNYNLIFAPHYNLFNPNDRDSLNENIIDKKYFQAKNIIIDTGSIRSVNMSYTLNSDIYIGDMSSQIYEFFIEKPKPCIFINANKIDWKNEKFYKNWHLGRVIIDITQLDTILNTRTTWQKDFEIKQIKAIKYTFDISKEISSSKRVANAIKKLVE